MHKKWRFKSDYKHQVQGYLKETNRFFSFRVFSMIGAKKFIAKYDTKIKVAFYVMRYRSNNSVIKNLRLK